MPTPVSLLVSAIKTALKSAEGGGLSRKGLRKELAAQLEECFGGDKTARNEGLEGALKSLLDKGRVSEEGTLVKWTQKGEKRTQAEVTADEPAETEAPAKKAKKGKAAAEQAAPAAGSPEAEEYRKANQISVVGAAVALPDPFASFDAARAVFGANVVDAMLGAGYTAPSPIQAQAWPVAINGGDLVAVAKTGSGKTLAFALPLLHAIKNNPTKSRTPDALVLAPTRELCVQIEEVVAKYAPLFGTTCVCVYGGVPKGPQIKALRDKPSIIVATPGRMVDLLNDKATDISAVKMITLDEADRMLDMGFTPQISELFGQMPIAGQRQVFFFTATWPKSVQKMAKSYLGDSFLHLNIGSTEELSANIAISQKILKITDDEKDRKLGKELSEMPDSAKVVIFTNTKRRADNIAKLCCEYGYGSASIHGDKTQVDREKALKAFKCGEWPVLVATDVASRGLDIDSVTHVVNFDMPRDVEGYVHRIGRTGRAGKTGCAITFWNPDYDTECAPALAKIARDAGQEVPDWLQKVADKMGKGKKLWAVDKIVY